VVPHAVDRDRVRPAHLVYNDGMPEDPVAMVESAERVRTRWALLLNVLAPGSGMIVLRQERLGVALGSGFGLGALLLIWGWWIVPGAVPRNVAMLGGALAVACFLAAQFLGWWRARRAFGSRARHEVARCRDAARQAIAEARYQEAAALLRSAVALDDENPELRAEQARLDMLMARLDDARDAWEAVCDLDEAGEFRSEALTALRQLPPDGS